MQADVRADGFDLALDGWVRTALVRGVHTFSELVRSLPGVYPAEALRAVRRLGEELPAGWQVSDTSAASRPLNGLPVEHPLDFDWRFAPEAVELLLDRCQGLALHSVAFLGTPSLAQEAVARRWGASISLFDQNRAVAESFRDLLPKVKAACVDLVWGDAVSVGHATVAVADPPWYPEHIAAFLWAASRLTRLGGRVLVSLPPEGTRPGVWAERVAVFKWATSFGLRLDSVKSGALPYWTPPFERNSLAAAGVPVVPPDWRRGDLAEFVVSAKKAAVRPMPPGSPDVWDDEAVGIVRIKCRRRPDNDFRDPTLSPVVPGDILATVSRRDPARASVDVWTCGNRVFRCAGTGVFRVIVSALRRRDDAERVVATAIGRTLSAEEAALVHRAVVQAADLVRCEERELAEDAR